MKKLIDDLGTVTFHHLFQSDFVTPIERDSFVIIGESNIAFVEFYDETQWLFNSDLWPKPVGLYKDFVVSIDDEDGDVEVCCKDLHNYPFAIYDEFHRECRNNPDAIATLNGYMQDELGKDWIQLLKCYAKYCRENGFEINRSYIKSREEFITAMPKELNLSTNWSRTVAYRDGGFTE